MKVLRFFLMSIFSSKSDGLVDIRYICGHWWLQPQRPEIMADDGWSTELPGILAPVPTGSMTMIGTPKSQPSSKHHRCFWPQFCLFFCLLRWLDFYSIESICGQLSYRWSCFFIMTRPGGKAGKWLSDSQLWTLLLFKGVRQHSVCESGMRQFWLFTFSEYGDFGWAGLRTQTQVEVNLCMFHPCRHADANVEVSPTEKIEEVEEKGTDKGGWQLTHVKEENQDRQWSTRNDAV